MKKKNSYNEKKLILFNSFSVSLSLGIILFTLPQAPGIREDYTQSSKATQTQEQFEQKVSYKYFSHLLILFAHFTHTTTPLFVILFLTRI